MHFTGRYTSTQNRVNRNLASNLTSLSNNCNQSISQGSLSSARKIAFIDVQGWVLLVFMYLGLFGCNLPLINYKNTDVEKKFQGRRTLPLVPQCFAQFSDSLGF